MANRTLVAYARDASYELHDAHDGVDEDALGPATPFGGPSDRDLAAVRERLEPLGIPVDAAAGTGSAVDPAPLATGVAWAALVDRLDYRAYDRLLRVDADWRVERFVVCWFGFGARGGERRDPRGDGALLPVAGDEAFVRGWFEGVKSTVADELRRGGRDEASARSYLRDRVQGFADGTRVGSGGF